MANRAGEDRADCIWSIHGKHGVMPVYQDMTYGLAGHDMVERQQYWQLLLQYCSVYTAALVMIWKYWTRGITPASGAPEGTSVWRLSAPE